MLSLDKLWGGSTQEQLDAIHTLGMPFDAADRHSSCLFVWWNASLNTFSMLECC